MAPWRRFTTGPSGHAMVNLSGAQTVKLSTGWKWWGAWMQRAALTNAVAVGILVVASAAGWAQAAQAPAPAGAPAAATGAPASAPQAPQGQAPPTQAPASQSPGGRLHGVVKSGNIPLPGVTVTAQNTLTGKKFSTTTDITGAWSMTLPQNGRYVDRKSVV